VTSGLAPASSEAATGPTMVSQWLSAHVIDVTSAARTVTVRVHLRSPFPLSDGSVSLTTRPSDPSTSSGDYYPTAPMSGPAHPVTDGWFTGTVTFPRYLPGALLDVGVNIGNPHGPDYELVVRNTLRILDSNPDLELPTVTHAAILPRGPAPLDVRTADRKVRVKVRIVDALSGVDGGSLWLEVRHASDGLLQSFLSLRLTSGTVRDGWWETETTLYRGSASGTYDVRLAVFDRAHSGGYAMSGPHIRDWLPLPNGGGSFEVLGAGDRVRPDVLGVRVSPTRIPLGHPGSRTVITVLVRLVDRDGGGVRTVTATAFGSGQATAVSMAPLSGTRANGLWRLRFSVPSDGGQTLWLSLSVADANHVTFYAGAGSPERSTWSQVGTLSTALLGGGDGSIVVSSL
jgi:hypothetical protein